MKTDLSWGKGVVVLLSVGMLAWGCSGADSDDDKANSAAGGSKDERLTTPGEDLLAQMDTSSPDGSSYEWGHDQYYSYDDSYYYSDGMMSDSGYSTGEGDEDPAGGHQQGELYGEYIENEFVLVSDEPISTFAIDVDTGSYTIMRRDLNLGVLPSPKSVRVEEYINYFRYDYPPPEDEHPFSLIMEVAPSLFGDDLHLMRIGIQGEIIPEEQRKPANLVFLVDVSGSMGYGAGLPLVKFLLTNLVGVLKPTDTIGIVTYAGSAGVVLQPTPVQNKSTILTAINGLSSGGSTAGGAGIKKAYELALQHKLAGGINRVILCTDGDFNVGVTGEALIDLIKEYLNSGITLSVFGFGMGNYNDKYMEQLSANGNGNYAYIDSQAEALHVLTTKLTAILQVIAKDVKVQVFFNPANVVRYRLVGYENRLLKTEDFKDDKVDAGEIGSGHTVTAFYEMELAEELNAERLALCLMRYKEPDGDVGIELGRDIFAEDMADHFSGASPSFRFAAAVVEFAEILRISKHSEGARFSDILGVVAESLNPEHPEEPEFLELVQKAADLWPTD